MIGLVFFATCIAVVLSASTTTGGATTRITTKPAASTRVTTKVTGAGPTAKPTTVGGTTNKGAPPATTTNAPTPKPTTKFVAPPTYDEMFVSASDEGKVYVSTAERGTTTWSKPVVFADGMKNPQGLALCGSKLTDVKQKGLYPYLFVADKDGNLKRFEIQRSGNKITAGKSVDMYGDGGKTRQVTDVLCDNSGNLYVADAKKGKIKKISSLDVKKSACSATTCDGDDWVGDECKTAVAKIKSMALLSSSTIVWATESDKPAAGVYKLAASSKNECICQKKDKCTKQVDPTFHKKTDDPLYGVAVIGSTIYYTKGDSKVKSMSSSGTDPKTSDVVDGFDKATYMAVYGKNLLVTDKGDDKVYSIDLTKKTKTELVTVKSANGIAYSVAPPPEMPPPTHASTVALSMSVALVAAIAALH